MKPDLRAHHQRGDLGIGIAPKRPLKHVDSPLCHGHIRARAFEQPFEILIAERGAEPIQARSGTRPAASPGTSTPVRRPSPKAFAIETNGSAALTGWR